MAIAILRSIKFIMESDMMQAAERDVLTLIFCGHAEQAE